MILLDTSGVLAWIDASQRHHRETAAAMAQAAPPFLLSPFVLAELDYLVSSRVGATAARHLLAEVAAGALRLEPFSSADVAACLEVIERFADQDVGLADASIVVLAERHRARDVLTLDQRHFRALRPRRGEAFRLFPADVRGGAPSSA